MNMKPTILLAVLASILAASSAAAISSADEVTLAEVLRKANILLDRLLARTEGSQSRNDQDFELQLDERYNPDKHRQSSSHVQTRNEERGVYDQGMPEFNADRKGRDEHARGIYDEGLPEFHADDSPKYERGRGIYDDGLPEFHANGKNRVGKDVDEDPVDEMSLKEAIEWLRQLREQRRNHPA